MDDLLILDEAVTSITGIGANPRTTNKVEDIANRLKQSVMSKEAKFTLDEITGGGLSPEEIGVHVKGKKYTDTYHYVAIKVAPGAGSSLPLIDTSVSVDVGVKSFDKTTFGTPTTVSAIRVQYATIAYTASPTAEDLSPANKSYSNLAGNLPAFLQNCELIVYKNNSPFYRRQLKDFFTPSAAVPSGLDKDNSFLEFSPKFFSPTDTITAVISGPKTGTLSTAFHFLNITFKSGAFVGQA